jgi:hypothetical protein
LPIKVAFVITTGAKREEGSLVPIVVFFIFVVLVVLGTVALGYGLSLMEDRTVGRRCRMSHKRYRRKKVRRQRVRCRFEA